MAINEAGRKSVMADGIRPQDIEVRDLLKMCAKAMKVDFEDVISGSKKRDAQHARIIFAALVYDYFNFTNRQILTVEPGLYFADKTRNRINLNRNCEKIPRVKMALSNLEKKLQEMGFEKAPLIAPKEPQTRVRIQNERYQKDPGFKNRKYFTKNDFLPEEWEALTILSRAHGTVSRHRLQVDMAAFNTGPAEKAVKNLIEHKIISRKRDGGRIQQMFLTPGKVIHGLPKPDPRRKPTQRKCLCCGDSFHSEGAGNRICGPCKWSETFSGNGLDDPHHLGVS